MSAYHHGPEPAEIAILLALVGLGLGSYALFWLGRVVRARQQQKHGEWLMRERLARWRWRAEHAAAERVAPAPPPDPESPAR